MAATKIPLKVGIIGGGQLAKMLADACSGLGIQPHILCREALEPAARCYSRVTLFPIPYISKEFVSGSTSDTVIHWENVAQEDLRLKKYLDEVDGLIIESEFVDFGFLKALSKFKPLFPKLKAILISQNKFEQKLFLQKIGIPTSDFRALKTPEELENALSLWGEVVIKKGTLGYDGKGVLFLKGNKAKLENNRAISKTFFEEHGDWLCQSPYAEKRVYFRNEGSVLVSRNTKGEIEVFPMIYTKQNSGICEFAWQPQVKRVNKIEKRAQLLAIKLVKSLDYVGVMAMEFFISNKGEILVNELAPRVHNSGHITMDALNVSQFEQHLRAVFGMPLVKPRWLYSGAGMMNILGQRVNPIDADESVDMRESNRSMPHFVSHLYWYGKVGHAQKRKLGHINVVGKTSTDALKKAMKIRKAIKI